MGTTPVIKDSGHREDFSTGSRRDTRDGKGRCDLLPMLAILRLSQHFEEGSKKYGDRNWELGQPLSRYMDSALRHGFKVLLGAEDEPHAEAMFWNIGAFVDTRIRIRAGELPAELDDIPRRTAEEIDRLFAILYPSESPETAISNRDHRVEGPAG